MNSRYFFVAVLRNFVVLHGIFAKIMFAGVAQSIEH